MENFCLNIFLILSSLDKFCSSKNQLSRTNNPGRPLSTIGSANQAHKEHNPKEKEEQDFVFCTALPRRKRYEDIS